MDHDLSKCEVGDWICTVQSGWTKIKNIDEEDYYSIETNDDSYTIYGFHQEYDKFPSAYIEPPTDWNVGPQPQDFKKDDKVLIRDTKEEVWSRRYFAYEKDGKYYCYQGGKDSWSSDGESSVSWCYIKPWTEEEEEE